MKSGLDIRWTEDATKNLDNIIIYLESNWTAKELTKFFNKLEKRLLLLSHFPDAYPISLKSKKVRRCVLSKNLTIYYTVKEQLISLFNTRRDPSEVKI